MNMLMVVVFVCTASFISAPACALVKVKIFRLFSLFHVPWNPSPSAQLTTQTDPCEPLYLKFYLKIQYKVLYLITPLVFQLCNMLRLITVLYCPWPGFFFNSVLIKNLLKLSPINMQGAQWQFQICMHGSRRPGFCMIMPPAQSR